MYQTETHHLKNAQTSIINNIQCAHDCQYTLNDFVA